MLFSELYQCSGSTIFILSREKEIVYENLLTSRNRHYYNIFAKLINRAKTVISTVMNIAARTQFIQCVMSFQIHHQRSFDCVV